MRGNGHRLYRHRPNVYIPYACHPRLHTAKTSPPACHIVNDWGFLYATPSYGIYTGRPSRLSPATAHRFLSVRCSTPRDARTERQHNTHCELYGGLIMLTSRTTTPPPPSIPERLRWNIARAGNCLPLDNSSYYFPSRPGVWSVFGVVEIVLCYNNAVRQKPQRIDLYRATDGRDSLHGNPLTRRAISGGIGKHS